MSEVTAQSVLEELYSRDPNKWTDEDIERIVSDLRAKRKHFAEAEAVAATKEPRAPGAPKAVAAPRPAKKAPPPQLSLDALGITITKVGE